MATINLNDKLAGTGNTDTLSAHTLEANTGGLRVSAGQIVENLGLTNVTTAGAATYTAAQLNTGLITRDPNGGARTDVTDTAANIIAGSPALSTDGDTITVRIINTADAAEAITIDPGTGVTIANAGQTIGQNESALLLLRRTSSTAVTAYIIGA